MKKTVTTVSYLAMFFLMLTWMLMYEDLGFLAFGAFLAAALCFGIRFGSSAYDAFHEVKDRRRGGE